MYNSPVEWPEVYLQGKPVQELGMVSFPQFLGFFSYLITTVPLVCSLGAHEKSFYSAGVCVCVCVVVVVVVFSLIEKV